MNQAMASPELVNPRGMQRAAQRGHARALTVGLLSLLLGVVMVLLGANLLRSAPESHNEGLLFVIPPGSAARLSEPGVESAITLPTLIRFGPGETAAISVRNDDTVVHRAGPFVVGPGETFTMRFPAPGEYPVTCTVNPAESIRVIVEA
ncbi:MAG: hypothetical protein KatS3mg059_1483 [Thermomicrobiales bacterium]|nr:MAG: hypothetical protein KatS3mg059_1483 [Thermomicrobiales bacterium]